MSYKRIKIIRALREYGFKFLREGNNHAVFTDGKVNIPVGRHREIDRETSRLIAKEIGVKWNTFQQKIS